MSSITQVDFKNKNLNRDTLKKTDINAYYRLIEKELLNCQDDILKYKELYEKERKHRAILETINNNSQYENQQTCEDSVIINVPKKIMELPIGDFVQTFSECSGIREATVLTSTLAMVSSITKNIYKTVYSKANFECATGLYHFGNIPPSIGKSPLKNVVRRGQDAAIEEYKKYFQKKFLDPDFFEDNSSKKKSKKFNPFLPKFKADLTTAGLEKWMTHEKLNSFSVQAVEKGFLRGLLSENSKSVSGFDLFLLAWVGEEHSVCRGGRNEFPTATVFGSIFCLGQNGTVEKILERSVDNDSDGFECRCIFTMEPPYPLKDRLGIEEFPTEIYSDHFYQMTKHLLFKQFNNIEISKRQDFKHLIPIRISEYSEQKIIKDVEKEFNYIFAPRMTPRLSEFIGKSKMFIQKLALNLYVMTEATKEKPDIQEVIPHEYVVMARDLQLEYTLNHFNVYKFCEFSADDLEINKILNVFDSKVYIPKTQLISQARDWAVFKRYKNRAIARVRAKEIIEKLINEKQLTTITKDNREVLIRI